MAMVGPAPSSPSDHQPSPDATSNSLLHLSLAATSTPLNHPSLKVAGEVCGEQQVTSVVCGEPSSKKILTKEVFSDLERSVCRMVNRQVATIAWFEADAVCGSHSVAIPLVLVLPYLCRFFQCLRQYKDTKEKACLLNALKYSTAVPVVFLSALKYHVSPDQWTIFYRPLWLISSVINSLYSFYWDIKRDWDLRILTRIFMFKHPSLWTNLLYGKTWVYYWVLGSNLVLRCAWTYKLSAHLRHNYLTVFTITALEMLRRFQWVFFRVENEWNRMTAKQNFEMSDVPSEGERLLDSSNHTV